MQVQSMAGTFTEVSLEDMVTFLKRAFRALRPVPGPVTRGEITYDLFLSPNTVIRIFTSVHRGQTMGADIGSDAIRIGLYSVVKDRPLKTGKLPIVKRTQGWRDNLKDRIEDEIEGFEERKGYWESRS